MLRKAVLLFTFISVLAVYPLVLSAQDPAENRLYELSHIGGVFDGFLGRLPLGDYVNSRTTFSDIEGMANIVVFGRSICGNTASYLRSTDAIISTYGLQNELNLLFFDIDRPASDVLDRQRRDNWANVKAFRGGLDLMWQALWAVGRSGGVTFSVVLYIDANGVPLILTHRDSGRGVPNNPFRSHVTTEDNISAMLGRDITRPIYEIPHTPSLPSSLTEVSIPGGAEIFFGGRGFEFAADARFNIPLIDGPFDPHVFAILNLRNAEWNGINPAQANDQDFLLFNWIMDNVEFTFASSNTSVVSIGPRTTASVLGRNVFYLIPHQAGTTIITATEISTGIQVSRTLTVRDLHLLPIRTNHPRLPDNYGYMIYTVQPGDSLRSIILLFYNEDIRLRPDWLDWFMQANDLRDPNLLYVGQQLIIGFELGTDGELFVRRAFENLR